MLNGKCKQDVIKRLKRIEGQVRGIMRMIEDDRYCMDILTQTRAIRSAMENVEIQVMQAHLKTCVFESFETGSQEEKNEKINEVLEVVANFRKYG